jgi:hypothetical protein
MRVAIGTQSASPALGRYFARKRALLVTWLRVNTAPFEIAASPLSRMYPESWKRA